MQHVEELLFELENLSNIYEGKQSIYDQMDQAAAKIKKEKNLASLFDFYVKPLYLIALALIIVVYENSLFVKILNNVTMNRFEFTGILDSLKHLSSDFAINMTVTIGIPLILCLAILLIIRSIIMNILTLIYENKVNKEWKIINDCCRELYLFYEEVRKNNIHQNFTSFQYCNPKQINNIISTIRQGLAYDIPGAIRLLQTQGKYNNYSYINIFNPVKNTQQTERADTHQEESPQENVYFQGCNTKDELKKRYRNLMKVFHTDSDAGDTSTAQKINKEYESMKKYMDN